MAIKSRQKHTFRDGFTVAGSSQFSAPIDVRTAADFLGTETHSGVVTFAGSVNWVGAIKSVNAQVTVNTLGFLKASSAAAQFAGLTRMASGGATLSVTVSTTVVKSNALIFLSPILGGPVPAGQASGAIMNQLCVTTITEGAFFTIGWLSSGVGIVAAPVDVAWKIELQA